MKLKWHFASRLQATTTTTTLTTGRVSRNGGDILNTTNAHTRASQGAEGALGTGSGSLGAIATGGADLDVEGGDTELLASGSNVLGSQHGSVRRRLIAISLDLHTTSDTDDGFTTSQIGNVL